ncbi:hypothetical protein HHI36_005501 [Cryptolaemus montrouzieri]|uniref:PiggyBac transposable element-derived protein 4 C-terminal zinc-ribbon domain-containing protein n=1 Tax=Cryptolaemus montrouzieri TaxID=559131 RepID=A0ABD2NV81_9CUCU
MAPLKALIIFTQKYPEWCKDEGMRRKFHQLLRQELAPNVKSREPNCQDMQKPTLEAIRLSLVENGERVEASHRNVVSSSNRCQFCRRKEDRQSRIKCSKCNAPVCNLHRREVKQFLCIACQNDDQ